MRTVFYKKLLYASSYMLVALFIEFLTFNVMGLGTFPEMLSFDLLILAMLALFIFILPSFKLEAIAIIIMLVVQSALSFVNEAMTSDTPLKTVFTIDQLMAATSVAGVFSDDYVSWPFLIGLIIIVSAEILFLMFLRRIKVKSQLKAKVQLAFFMVFIFSLTVIGSSYGVVYNRLYSPDDDSGEYYLITDDKMLFSNPDYSLKLKAFKRFGTFAFYYKNLYNTLNDGSESLKKALKNINDELGEDFHYNDATCYTGAYTGNNLIMIMMESAEWFGIDEQLTPTLYALTQDGITSDSYISKNKTNQSEMISMLGSFPVKTNLQSELEEDVNKNQISYPFSLPNILNEEGYTTTYIHNNSEDFYNRVKTHEALGFDRLYFHENVELDNEYKTTDNFYDFESDYEFFKSVTREGYVNPDDQPFMSFFTTLSMHGNYNDLLDFIEKKDLSWNWDYSTATPEQRQSFENDPDTNEFLYQYYDSITKQDFLDKFGEEVERLNLSESQIHTVYLRYKQYQAAYMDLDRGVNVLINDLYQKGQLDNTTILMFADHDCYYHEMNFSLRGLDVSENYNLNLYSVPFILYDGSMDLVLEGKGGGGYTALDYKGSEQKKIEPSKSNVLVEEDGRVKINKWFSTYDFVPTLLDLFGYKYNTNLYHGINIFNETLTESDRHIFVSYESGTYNDTFFVGGDGIFHHVGQYNGEAYVFRIDEENDVLYWKQEKGTRIDLDEVSVLSKESDQYKWLMEKKKLFEQQWENYRYSHENIFEKVYSYKFFLYSDVKDQENKSLYPYADIKLNVNKR